MLYLVTLHNILQRMRKTMDWKDDIKGALHRPIWSSTLYVDGMECTTGRGSSKRVAREDAAKEMISRFDLPALSLIENDVGNPLLPQTAAGTVS